MNVLITGAQFANKGAQSMLFTVVNEIRNRYENAEVYYLPLDYFREDCFSHQDDYKFHFVYDDLALYDYPVRYGVVGMAKRKVDDIVMHTKMKQRHAMQLSKVWKQIDVLIDISGYALTSRFGIASINRMLRHINKAKSMDIPVIILPQSFGPLDFGNATKKVCKRIKKGFGSVDLLFAREQQGYDVLAQECGLKNALLSPDIVLQSGEIQWENVFTTKPNVEVFSLPTQGNVGVVPNGETVKNGNKETVLRCYVKLISALREKGKEIYIFRHSDDLALCKEIYELVKEDPHCHLIETEMDCLSYSAFVRQFDFVIASRFHSVVHAYRENVPAFVLGWAIKYQELTKLLGQEKYCFDIVNAKETEFSSMVDQLCLLADHFAEESEKIKEKMSRIQEENCFLKCWDVMDKI